MKDLYIYHRGKKLKCGYTTGSCATAASKAAALMLLKQTEISDIRIETPAGVTLDLPIRKPCFDEASASCCVVKDAGDDHDATDGIEIYSKVSRRQDGKVVLSGGEGVGRVTKPGFWGNPGEPAINPIPRQMIEKELLSLDQKGWDVLLSVPEGEAVAHKTLNRKIGIEGGISIIGTTGIVEPMSMDALKQTIYLEIDDVAKSGASEILLVLGNYGKQLADKLEMDLPCVKVSNFIGDAVLYCHKKQFKRVLLLGHIGKLCKLSIGAFNTHSSICDARIEAFVFYLALAGAPRLIIEKVLKASDTEGALKLVQEEGYGEMVHEMRKGCLERIKNYVKDPSFNIEVMIYSMEQGVLNQS